MSYEEINLIICPYWVEMTALEGVGSKFHHIKK